jgi:predicted secreted protein
MAETLGLNGVVRLSDTGTTLSATHNMLNVTAFSIEETSETIDTTSMGDASREIVATFKGFSGTVDGYWDIDDAAIGHDDSPTAPVVTAGDKIDFEVYPGGLAVANLAVYKGSAIVTSISRSQSFDGVTEYSMTFEGTGDLSYDKTPTP